MSMSLQVILNRLSKVSDTQTKLSKTRKFDLSLADDLSSLESSIIGELDDVESYFQDVMSHGSQASNLLDEMRKTYDSLEGYAQSIGSYESVVKEKMAEYERLADELGIDPMGNNAYNALSALESSPSGIESTIRVIDISLNTLDGLIKGIGQNL